MKDLSQLTIFVRRSISDVRQDLKYAPDTSCSETTIQNAQNVRGLATINLLIGVVKPCQTSNAKSRSLFSQNSPSYMFEMVLNVWNNGSDVYKISRDIFSNFDLSISSPFHHLNFVLRKQIFYKS